MRVCNVPGCPTLTNHSRCEQHRRDYEKRRGSRHERGYGTDHDKRRAAWTPRVATGRIHCWRCGNRIHPTEPWDLGHDDHDRSRYRGPEHQACNRSAGGKAAHP